MNQIDAMKKELAMRELAAPNLSGIPAQQNASSIDGLYDAIINASLDAFELTNGS